jgi:hypothetical protein
MSGKATKIVLAVILCFGILFAYYKISNSGNTTYVSARYNYSFEYPKSWKLFDSGKASRESEAVSVYDGPNRFTIIHYTNAKNYAPDEWYRRDMYEKLGDGNYPYPKAIVLSEGVTTFSNLPAYKVMTNDAGLSYDYFISKGKDFYVLSFERYDGEKISKTQLVFDQIEKTFSFK